MRHCLSSTARQSGCFQGCHSEGSATHARLLSMPRTPLQKILAQCRASSQTEREKGSYFEELIRTYFRFEASYADLYSYVWIFGDWAKEIARPSSASRRRTPASTSSPRHAARRNTTPSSANATTSTTASCGEILTASSPPQARNASPSASSAAGRPICLVVKQ